MENNFYNMNSISKNSLERNKRIQSQAANFLAEYDKTLKESLEAKESRATEAAMSSARLSYQSGIARSRSRVTNLTEEINYTVNSSIIGMTEMIAQVVEGALLLDEAEYAELNPTYKEDIREIISDFLREAEINENITNEDTLALMEHVAKTLPGVREGKNLTEEDLSKFIYTQSPLEINRSIKNLSGDVSNRVATLMEKEQKRAEKTEKDVKRATNKAAKDLADEKDPSLASPDEIIAALENGEMTVEDVDDLLKNGDISQDVYDQVVDAYMDHAEGADDNVDATSGELAAQAQNPVVGDEMGADPNGEIPPEGDPAAMGAEDPNAMGVDPAMAGGDAAMADPNIDPNAAAGTDPAMVGGMPTAGGIAPGMPKKQVQMLPDGTMNINIYESVEPESSKLYKIIRQLDEKSIDKIINKVFGHEKIKKHLNVSLEEILNETLESKKRIIISALRQGKKNKKAAATVEKLEREISQEDILTEALVLNKVLWIIGLVSNAILSMILIMIGAMLTPYGGASIAMIGAASGASIFLQLASGKEIFDFADKTEKNLKDLNAKNGVEEPAKKENTFFKESYLVRETPRCGLIESLAVNDAMNRLAEGKSYDPDLSLANAIMYVTITETMNAMGLMNIDEQVYNHIISEAGGCPGAEEKSCTMKVHKSVKSTDVEVKEAKDDGSYSKMASNVAETMRKNSFVNTLNETVLVSQHVPSMNRSNPDDLAERIRQKKLMKEQGLNPSSNGNLLID